MGFVRNRRRVGGRTLAAALLGTTFLVGLAGPALADGHLEAENAALRSMMEELQQELQILKNMVLEQNKKNMEQDESIAAAAEPSAPAKMVKSGKDNVSLKIYGQVNRMALYADDGKDSRVFHADNDVSSTRVGFKGKAKLDDEWSAGTTLEVQIESNSSAKVEMNQDTKAEDAKNFSERKLEVWFKSKQLGKLSLGQGSTASDGTIEEDLSGTGVITGAGYSATGDSLAILRSGIQMVDDDDNDQTPDIPAANQRMAADTGVVVGDLFGNMDGLSRKDRLRYDTPTFGGVQLSSSILSESWEGDEEGTGGTPWDVALRYGRDFDGFEVAAAISRWDKDRETKGHGGSASLLMPTGTSVSGSHSVQETDGDEFEETFTYFKLGQELDITSAGKTAVSVSYSTTDNRGSKGHGGNYYDFAAVQKIKGLGAELYALYGVYSPDIEGMATEDINVAGLGARIKF